MRKMLWGCLAIVLAMATPVAAAADGPRLPDRFHRPISTEGLDLRLFDEAVTIFANAARKQHGKPPLRADPALARAAAAHAHNMAKLRTHSHKLPVAGEGRLVQRMARNSVKYRTAGENIGMEKVFRLTGRPISTRASGCSFTYADTGAQVPVHTYATLAEAAVRRWMASPKHRASLLSTAFKRIGNSAAVDPKGAACGDVYLVQNFAG